jgi:hypothetical protein
MKRTIIAVWHTGGKGKSETIRQTAIYTLEKYKGKITILFGDSIPETEDFILIVEIEINGRKIIIAFISQGDPHTGLKKKLNEAINKYNPSVVLCTCRTRGTTVHEVEQSADENDYEIIWTSTYQVAGKENQVVANRLKGKHLVELIIDLDLL